MYISLIATSGVILSDVDLEITRGLCSQVISIFTNTGEPVPCVPALRPSFFIGGWGSIVLIMSVVVTSTPLPCLQEDVKNTKQTDRKTEGSWP